MSHGVELTNPGVVSGPLLRAGNPQGNQVPVRCTCGINPVFPAQATGACFPLLPPAPGPLHLLSQESSSSGLFK